MNIFVVDRDPWVSGEVLPDKLIVKMPLETAQMLSVALHYHGYHGSDIYKGGYKHHPCSKWAYANRANYLWLCEHGLSLSSEYTTRYGKIHKSQYIIERAIDLQEYIPHGYPTPFVQAMDEKYTHYTDTTIAYKRWVKSKSYFVGGYRKGRDFTSFFDRV